MGQPRNSSQSGDHQPVNDDAAATAAAHGDSLNSLRGDEINPSPPSNSELVGQPGAPLSAVQQILPITATSVSESIDVVDAPNVASPTTESRPVESHETILQGGEPTDRESPPSPLPFTPPTTAVKQVCAYAATSISTPANPFSPQPPVANPALIIRTSAPAPGTTPASNANAQPIDPSSPSFTFPTRSNTEFIASFPQTSTNSSSMLFTHGAGAAHRRRSMANTSALTEYEADLTSKDRLKQKEAVRNILATKIRNDWSFPNKVDSADLEPSEALPPGDPAQPTSWIERADWLSELSSSDDSDANGLAQTSTNSTSGADKKPKIKKKKINPFRFDTPDGVGEALRRSADRRKLRRQRKLQEELTYNEGLRCF
ncbi:hypothetical protein V500_10295, partial [Pseudogymnoascus sp. VKM F-4518 (FW-2643)]